MRRILIPLLALLSFNAHAVDAVLVGQISGENDLTTSAGTTTSGSTFVVAISFISSSTITSVTDNKSNPAYTLIDLESSGGQSKALYRCENCTGGAGHSATVDLAGSSFGTVYLIEVTGAATASFDETASAADGTSPYTVDLAALDQASEVIVSIIGSESGGTVTYSSSNTTVIGSETDGNAHFTSAVSKHVVSSTAAFTPAFTSDGSGMHMIVSASFKAAAAGTGALLLRRRRG
jgi:hypothetical protein